MEQDLLAAMFGDLAFSVKGSDTSEKKERDIIAWINGDRPVMISKVSIMGWGLNFQHCNNVAFVGRTFSYEAYFQAVRRCWRFGQKRPVNVHIAVGEGEDLIAAAVERKADDHAEMQQQMRLAMRRNARMQEQKIIGYNPKSKAGVPTWLNV